MPTSADQWNIRPKTMDAGRLATLRTDLVSAIVSSPNDIPMISAVEAHSVLCHLEAREEAMQSLAKSLGEAAARHKGQMQGISDNMKLSLERKDCVIDEKDGVIAKLQSKDAESAQRISELETIINK